MLLPKRFVSIPFCLSIAGSFRAQSAICSQATEDLPSLWCQALGLAGFSSSASGTFHRLFRNQRIQYQSIEWLVFKKEKECLVRRHKHEYGMRLHTLRLRQPAPPIGVTFTIMTNHDVESNKSRS